MLGAWLITRLGRLRGLRRPPRPERMLTLGDSAPGAPPVPFATPAPMRSPRETARGAINGRGRHPSSHPRGILTGITRRIHV